jgi:UDP-N-acetylglucosamine--N-acetylmuramyl-(pentapeptide) pyrophosphoryl-undecaprenol N-acetylglucosamine transferase
MSELSARGVQVLHVTGQGKEFAPEVTESGAPYVVVPYTDRMDLAYSAADLVVARAGANTVCELTAVGLPAVYVPLPIGNGEQRLNATDVVAAGGGMLVDDAALTAQWVESELIPLATDAQRIATMSAASRALGEPEADERLADLVDEAFRGTR